MVKKISPKIYLIIILALLYAPIIFVVVFSFSNTTNFTFPRGFSLEGYRAIFTSSHAEKLLDSLKNTIIIAVISSIASTIIGSVSAVGIFYMKPKTKATFENINQLPIVNSEIVMAVSLMLFFTTFSFPTGWLRIIIGHITFCTPYVILSVMPRLMQMDSNIYEAALDLGASPVKALVKVILPIIFPGIISGAAIAFTLSIDDFIITQINKGAATGIDTLSTYLYSSTRSASGFEPFWYPLFTIIIIIVITIVLLVNLNKFKTKGKKKEEED
ncbi:MAG: Inner membrane ABC transporter permease protein YdcV [Firmicutes bacterium ADurb.Bin080]|jgi:spermidine/putrescine transport system permease protein|nr:ABC transporter permease [Clostridiales bacterium]OQC12723.1 MAG: Inner membrane ABC transporter permease protein YdcV [Firmicutes bacterium ADurb.Bin080]